MNQTIFITGASSGYGRATAQHFLDRGWNVVATARRPPASKDRFLSLPLDVTDPDSISKALEKTVETFGGVDVVVNNAGIGLLSAFEVTPDDVLRRVFETNTFGVMNVCRAAIPLLRGKGTLVNVTSSAAIAPMPLVAVYTASKCAIEGFTESLAYELRLLGIRVRLVEPGLAPTTNFASSNVEGLTPPPYEAFAHAYFDRMRNYPTAYAKEAEIAEAVWSAVHGEKLRYPAGPDAQLVAQLRWTPEDRYLARMAELFVP